ncbi:MAG: hypothetical protein ACK5WX_02555, partial [bacterium]
FDARYSMETAGFEPMWGVRVYLSAEVRGARLAWHSGMARREDRMADLVAEIFGMTPEQPGVEEGR